MKASDVQKATSITLATIMAAGALAQPAQAITKSELNQLSYLQVKGTGLANRCPEVIGEGSITPKGGQKVRGRGSEERKNARRRAGAKRQQQQQLA